MLNEKTLALCQGLNFAAFTTLLPDGHPQTQLMWVDCDAGTLLINTEIHRVKFENIERDPRVSVTVWDRTNPYSYVEVRGRVVESVRGSLAREHIDQLARKYTGTDYANEITSERVILKIAPDREMVH